MVLQEDIKIRKTIDSFSARWGPALLGIPDIKILALLSVKYSTVDVSERLDLDLDLFI